MRVAAVLASRHADGHTFRSLTRRVRPGQALRRQRLHCHVLNDAALQPSNSTGYELAGNFSLWFDLLHSVGSFVLIKMWGIALTFFFPSSVFL